MTNLAYYSTVYDALSKLMFVPLSLSTGIFPVFCYLVAVDAENGRILLSRVITTKVQTFICLLRQINLERTVVKQQQLAN